MQLRDKLYINGAWTAPHGNGSIDVHGAATEEVIARIPEGDEHDANSAVAAARAAFEGWAGTLPADRAAFLAKINEGMKARSEEIGRTIAQEVGMPVKLATRIQAGSPTFTFGMYAKMLGTFQWEEKVGNSIVLREPVGVVACITPWNYPLHQIAAKVAPAIAAGCTVVLKPSEVAPLNAFILAEIIDSVGLPKGVFNLVTGYGPAVGEALVKHPDVDMVSFTGSTRAGKRVSELASATVKRVALELGGKSASIVLDDADLAAAVRARCRRASSTRDRRAARTRACSCRNRSTRRPRSSPPRRRSGTPSAIRWTRRRSSAPLPPRRSASACAGTSARASRTAPSCSRAAPTRPKASRGATTSSPPCSGK
jgi:betaine-aldehyde dehydrogenase